MFYCIGSPSSTFTYTVTGVHLILWLITTFCYFMTSYMDPGYLKQEFKLMHLLENFHSDDICARCEVLTTPRSHHCNIDDRCIERWDHHCPWINNCVGVRNSGYFMVQLFTTFLLLLMYIEPPITDLVLENHGHVIVNKYYMMLCVYCYSDKLFIPIYVATILIALIG